MPPWICYITTIVLLQKLFGILRCTVCRPPNSLLAPRLVTLCNECTDGAKTLGASVYTSVMGWFVFVKIMGNVVVGCMRHNFVAEYH